MRLIFTKLVEKRIEAVDSDGLYSYCSFFMCYTKDQAFFII